MDTARFSEWFDRYRHAWRSHDPGEIAALFTPDAVYRADPFDEGVVGPEAIVPEWMEVFEEDSEEEFEMSHEVVAVNGDVGVVQGWITYTAGRNRDDWRNLFIIELDDQNRCRSYLEWYMRRSRTG
ncbi:MAG TPA: nuclear transport factor 2 family protein [Acidimicrobiia bacterium]|nr:nuclear transport factor 2 family protein [Acidimicrobiia bacterium]